MPLARMMGCSLADVSKLSSSEIALWNIHLAERPPDAIERLLAQILVVLIRANSDKAKTKIFDVAPWLESARDRRAREDAQKNEHLALVLQLAKEKDNAT